MTGSTPLVTLDPAPLAMVHRVGSAALVGRIVRLFLETAPARVAELEAAHGRGDAAGVRRAAHALRGSAAQLGGTALEAATAALERGTPAEALAPGAVSPVERELALLRDALLAVHPAADRADADGTGAGR